MVGLISKRPLCLLSALEFSPCQVHLPIDAILFRLPQNSYHYQRWFVLGILVKRSFCKMLGYSYMRKGTGRVWTWSSLFLAFLGMDQQNQLNACSDICALTAGGGAIICVADWTLRLLQTMHTLSQSRISPGAPGSQKLADSKAKTCLVPEWLLSLGCLSTISFVTWCFHGKMIGWRASQAKWSANRKQLFPHSNPSPPKLGEIGNILNLRIKFLLYVLVITPHNRTPVGVP